MKRIVSVLLAVCLLLGLFCVMPAAASAQEDADMDHTLTIGVNYTLRQLDPASWKVHYWNGDGLVGDANVTPLGYEREKDLTAQYPGLDKTFIMYTAEVPAAATGYCVCWSDNVTYWFTANGDGSIAGNNTAYCFHLDSGDRFMAEYAMEEQDTITVYCANTRGWKEDGFYIHYWNQGYSTVWHGIPMTYAFTYALGESMEMEIYKATVPADVKGFVFNGFLYNGDERQTVDITGDLIADNRVYYPNADWSTFTLMDLPTVVGYSLTLDDEIAVNYYLHVDSAFTDDIETIDCIEYNFTASYSYGSDGYYKEAPVTFTKVDGTEYNGANWKVTCPVNARAMTDTVTLTVSIRNRQDNSSTPVLISGYRIVDYCASAGTVYSGNTDLKNLFCAMLEYGSSVQTYFGYRADDLADSAAYMQLIGNPDWQSPQAPDTLDDDTGGLPANEPDISYLGASLAVTGQTTINLYFTSGCYVEKSDGTDLSHNWVETGDPAKPWCLRIPLPAKDIFTPCIMTFTVAGGTGATYFYPHYCAANYYNYVMASSEAKYTKVQPVLKKMWAYSAMAAALFDNTNQQ